MTPSANFDDRPAGKPVDMLILHYTGMKTAEEALTRLVDPESKVSAHYLIDEDGTVHSLVPEDKRAWHAGVSQWAGETDINGCSIGIELVNPGHEFGYRPFPDAQINALVNLVRDILHRHPVPAHHVLGHSDVAPERKTDPGELFDWQRLARAGIGLWPEIIAEPDDILSLQQFQQLLRRYGYPVKVTDIDDIQTRRVVEAFERHFRPTRISGRIDPEITALILALNGLI